MAGAPPTFVDDAFRLAVDTARRLGIPAEDASLLRAAHSVLVRFPSARLVARVERPERAPVAARQVLVARVLARCGVSALRLRAVGEAQPIAGRVTWWELLEVEPGAVPPDAVGRLARALHRATAGEPPESLPVLDPLDEVREWLELAGPRWERLGPLWERHARLREAWPDLAAGDPLGAALVHGDLNEDNVVRTLGGPVLVDLELAGWGPASWDLAPAAIGVLRYGDPPAALAALCAGYGADPRDAGWDGWAALCEVYELVSATWTLANWETRPELEAEGELRLAGLLDGDRRTWTRC